MLGVKPVNPQGRAPDQRQDVTSRERRCEGRRVNPLYIGSKLGNAAPRESIEEGYLHGVTETTGEEKTSK
jgi:hypothetical protein